MSGPFATASRRTPIHQMSLPVLSHAACASMSTTTTTTRDRGDRYGPMEQAQLFMPAIVAIRSLSARSLNALIRTGLHSGWRQQPAAATADVCPIQWLVALRATSSRCDIAALAHRSHAPTPYVDNSHATDAAGAWTTDAATADFESTTIHTTSVFIMVAICTVFVYFVSFLSYCFNSLRHLVII